jgi:hypothetical protein
MFRMRNTVRKLAILAAPLLFFGALVAQAPSASAASGPWAFYTYSTTNPGTLPCLVYSSGALYLQSGCSTTEPYNLNHVALWNELSEPAQGGYPTYELQNVHAGVCLTGASDGGVYVAACGTNHVQWWELDHLTSNEIEFINVHTGLPLDVQGNYLWEEAS